MSIEFEHAQNVLAVAMVLFLLLSSLGTSIFVTGNGLIEGSNEKVEGSTTLDAGLQSSDDIERDWNYRKQMNISNPVNDYQMEINITYSGGGDVSCEGHCNSNFSDLRFTASDGSTYRSYWIEEKVNGSYANVWVNTSGESEMYLYYGNPSAGSRSNGTATFPFFEDFEGQSDGENPDGWTQINEGDEWAIDTARSYHGGASLKCDGTSGSTKAEGYYPFQNGKKFSEIHWFAYVGHETRWNNDGHPLHFNNETGDRITGVSFTSADGDNDLDPRHHPGAQIYDVLTTQQWIEANITDFDFTNYSSDCRLSTPGYSPVTWDDTPFYINQTIHQIYTASKGWNACPAWYDLIFTVKYSQTKPSWSGFGIEESAPFVTTTIPSDGDQDVDVGIDVSVIFPDPMNTNVTPVLNQINGTDPGGWNFQGWSSTYDADDTVTWTHNDWNFHDLITLNVTNYEDLEGNMGSGYEWSFITQYSHDLNVTYMETLPDLKAGEQVILNGTISNDGYNNEGPIDVELIADSIVQNSTTISTLNSGESTNVTIGWTPSVTGTRLVELYAVPVTGETDTSDNVLNQTIYTDGTPPSIHNLTEVNGFLEPDQSVDIYSNISEDYSLDGAELYYTYNTSNWTNVTMTVVSGNSTSALYMATIPAPYNDTTVYYYVNTTDVFGNFNVSVTKNYSTNFVPEIENITHEPMNPNGSSDVNITADITDNDGLNSTMIYYSYDGGATWNNGAMNNSTGDEYYYLIPAVEDNVTVQYYIEATDNVNITNTSSIHTYPVDNILPTFEDHWINPPYPNASNPVNVSMAITDNDHIENATLYYSMDGMSSWSPVNMTGPHEGLLFNDTFPTSSINGSNWVSTTNSPEVNTMGQNEPTPPYSLNLDGSDDTITSKEIDTTDINNLNLTFYYELSGGGENPDPGDYLYLDYYDSFGTWTNIWQINGDSNNHATFHFVEQALPSDAYHEDFQFRFRSIGSSSMLDDFFVDNVKLFGDNNWKAEIPAAGVGVSKVYYYVNATDSARNTNTSLIYNYTIDSTPPEIVNVSSVQSPKDAYEDTTIFTNVSEEYSGIDEVNLYYTYDGINWTNTSMTFVSGNITNATYQAVIPSPNNETTVNYYVEVFDRARNSNISSQQTFQTNYPPDIENVSRDIQYPNGGTPINITANISDSDGIHNATLYYTNDGGTTWSDISMSWDSGDEYYGIIPAQGSTVWIDYYIRSYDTFFIDNSSALRSFYVDADPPEIGTPTITPTNPNSTVSVNVTIPITDANNISYSELYYSFDNMSSWSSTTMVYQSGNIWEGTIPAAGSGVPIVYYYVETEDVANNQNTSQIFNYTIDSTPPEIVNVTDITGPVNIYDSTTIYTNVSDTESGLYQAELYYTYDGANWTSTTMSFVSGNSTNATYSAVIPASMYETTVGYYVVAYDNANNTNTSITHAYDTDAPPEIEDIDHSPVHPNGTTAVNITANITDDDGIDDAQVYYSFDGGATWNNVSMNNSNADEYYGIIPAVEDNVTVQYFIQATDNLDFTNGSSIYAYFVDNAGPWFGVPFIDPANPDASDNVNVTIPIYDNSSIENVTLYYSYDNQTTWNSTDMNFNERYFWDFEGPVTWTHSGVEDEWERGDGDPGGDDAADGDDQGPTSAYSGSNAWATDLDGPYNTHGSDWNPDLIAQLRSPRVQLSDDPTQNLTFWDWLEIEGGSYDYCTIQIYSHTDGTYYTLASDYDTTHSWQQQNFALPSECIGDEIEIVFNVYSDEIVVEYGWVIDDVRINDPSVYGTIPPAGQGVERVHYYVTASDVAGNQNTTEVYNYTIDITPPVADAGSNMTISENTSVTFDGTNSTDNVGIINYTWTFTDGSQVVLNGSTPSYLFTNIGNYTVTLNVTDYAGHYDTDTIWVNVTDDTTPPNADAGSNRTVPQFTTVYFDGTNSTDDAGIDNYTWTLTDGTLVELYGPEPDYTFNNAGNFTVTLNVTDINGNWALDTIWVNVTDIIDPNADAGADRTVPQFTTVTFDGGNSTDNVAVTNYTWTFTDGVPVTLYGENPDHTFNNVGNFSVTLNVSDAEGNWDTDMMWVNVTDAADPNADAGADRTIPEKTSITFDGSNSTDNIGIVNYTWTFTDSGQVTLYGISPSYQFNNVGNYTVTLNVTDAEGNWDTDNMWVNVTDDTTPPNVDAGSNRNVLQFTTVSFDGTNSTDNVGIDNYTWTLTDGTLIELYGPEPDYTFNNAGNYTVTLNVTDVNGNWALDTLWVDVTDVVDPNADAGADRTVPQFTTVTFDGGNSTDNVAVNNYTWTFTDGVPVTLYGENPDHTFNNVGNFSVTLNVSDAEGNWDTDVMWVNVTDDVDPNADAGADRNVLEGKNLVFDGSNSTDNVGIVNYTWNFTYSGQVTLYGVTPSFEFNNVGNYSVTLNVTDAEGNWDTDIMWVNVSADTVPPVADAGADRTVPQTTFVQFDGSNSTDNIGVETYNWTFVDGSQITLNGVDPTYQFNNVGNYSVTLNVTDEAGNWDTDVMWVNVTDGIDPTADAGADRSVNLGAIVVLDGSNSTDNVGVENYTWTFDDNGAVTLYGVDPSYQFDNIGNFEIILNVSDGAGNWDTDMMWVNVTDQTDPTAFAGADRSITQGESVTLDGDGSTDNVGIDNYTWTFTDGSQVNLYGVYPNYRFENTGDYEIILNVTDTSGNWDTDVVWVNVSADTVPPVADAGDNRTVPQFTTVQFDGSNSTDDASVDHYTWTFTDGAVISLYGVDPSYTFDNVGQYEVTLNVTDYGGNWDTDTMTVVVTDAESPDADAGPDRNILEGETVTLNGSGSSDNVGIINYTWSFTDGGLVELYGPEVDYRFENVGDYQVTLNVSDSEGNWDTDVVWVNVSADVTDPTADAGQDRDIPEGQTVQFDGSNSSDNVGIENYTWTFTDGSLVELYGVGPSYTFNSIGDFEVTLTVTDSAGNTDSDTVWINVTDATPPAADAGPDQDIDLGMVVNLDGTGSSDNVGVTNHTWIFDDDGTVTLYGETPSYQFQNPGDHRVQLTVRDAAGNTDSDYVWINVTDTLAPVADAGSDISVVVGTTVQFDGTGSTDNVGVVSYTWTFHDDRERTLFGTNPEYTFNDIGTYQVTLNVSDAEGNWDEDIVVVEVTGDTTSPVAVAGQDRTISIGGVVEFNATASSDDVGITEYNWVFEEDGGTVRLSGDIVLYVFDSMGTYEVQLTVSDEAGNTDTDTVVITVEDMEPPTADAGEDTTVGVGEQFTLDATGSTDNIEISSYVWTIEGVDYNQREVTYSFQDVGEHMVELQVTDSSGNTDTDQVLINVLDRTEPQADAGEDVTVEVGEDVTLDAGDSSDNTGISTYTWIIDGDEYDGCQVNHTFESDGEYTVELRVEDEYGNVATDTLTVTVETSDGGDGGGDGGDGQDGGTQESDDLFMPLWAIILLVIILVVVSIIAFILIRKEKEPPMRGQPPMNQQGNYNQPPQQGGQPPQQSNQQGGQYQQQPQEPDSSGDSGRQQF